MGSQRGGCTTTARHSQIDFDFVDHSLPRPDARGPQPLLQAPTAGGVPVADFDVALHQALSELGVDVEIREHPFGLPITTPFPQDREHASWDRDAIERYSSILDWSDSVFEEFSGWFSEQSPVHLFWHSLDLAVTRFSGRPAPPIDADAVTQEAYSQGFISFGFWAGDDNVPDASYYSYTSPEPAGLRDQALPAGDWIEFGSGSLAILPYDAVRTAPDPRGTLLRSCKPGTKPARDWPAGGKRAPLSRTGVPPRASSRSFQATAAQNRPAGIWQRAKIGVTCEDRSPWTWARPAPGSASSASGTWAGTWLSGSSPRGIPSRGGSAAANTPSS